MRVYRNLLELKRLDQYYIIIKEKLEKIRQLKVLNQNVIEVFSPAKINLFLAVIGERGDGYHDILSLAGTVKFGDFLKIELVPEGKDIIECRVAGVPLGEENLIMKAIKAVRQKHTFSAGVKVCLDKKIPMGAGLGGGSSNGVVTLKALNELLGGPLSKEEMREIALGLGSDCLIFLDEGLKVVRGRGEDVVRAGIELEEKIKGRGVIIFKPKFSVNTGWAYEEMRKNPGIYVNERDAEVALNVGIGRLLKGMELEGIFYNNFENVIFKKYKELKRMMDVLYEEFNVKGLLSGSGSACFVLLRPGSDGEEIKNRIKEELGEGIFVVETEME